MKENDAQCKRYDAINDIRRDLRKTLGIDGDVRAHLMVFSTRADYIVTYNNFLRVSNNKFSREVKPKFCQADGGTNMIAALGLTSDKLAEIEDDEEAEPKDMKAMVFLTDGVPNNWKFPKTIARNLKQSFEGRTYTILLWPGVTKWHSIFDFFYTLSNKENIRRINKANDIGKAISDFVE